MAKAWVPIQELEAGTLPAVCARSGEPTDHVVATHLVLPPAWAPFALFVGLVPFVLVAGLGAVRVEALLPLQRRLRDRLVLALRVRNVALAVAGVAFVCGVVPGALPVWFVLAMAAACVALVATVAGFLWSVGARTDISRTWVRLSGVAPAFAAAALARYGQAHAPSGADR